MKKASKAFSSGYDGLPPHIQAVIGATVPSDLQFVADAFVDLQGARHDADYNVAQRLTRSEALSLVQFAQEAYQAWMRVRSLPEARVYLASLIFWSRWNK